jgi:hypothetical protein
MILSSLKEVPACQYRYVLFIHIMGITVQTMIVLKGGLYILIQIEINLEVIFLGLNAVVESRLCQLYCRRLVCMVYSSNVLWFCPNLKGTCVC